MAGWMRLHKKRSEQREVSGVRHVLTAIRPSKASPRPFTAHEIAHVQQWIKTGRAQAALEVSKPGDAMEEEADRTAEQVMKMPEKPQAAADVENARDDSTTVSVARDVMGHAAAKEPETVAGGLETQLESLRTASSAPLSAQDRQFFEARFQRDFSGVRVHTGPAAERLGAGIQAKAFTVGKDIVFGRGQYRPGSFEGRRLLAHELTHTVQQKSAGARIQRQGSGSPPASDKRSRLMTLLQQLRVRLSNLTDYQMPVTDSKGRERVRDELLRWYVGERDKIITLSAEDYDQENRFISEVANAFLIDQRFSQYEVLRITELNRLINSSLLIVVYRKYLN